MVKPSIAFRHRALAAAAIAASLLAPTSAQAGTAGSALIASAVANIAVAGGCRATSLAGEVQSAGTAALISRAPVRTLSALDRMRMQQGEALVAPATVGEQPVLSIECAGLTAVTRVAPDQKPGVSTRSLAFLHSRILPVSTTAFDADWRRVSHADAGAMRGAVAAIGGTSAGRARIAGVNAWVNRKVAYTPDAKLYGKADHWATARETLARGKGDCEDYAIAKMAILAALGVPRSDMYLTIARDLVRQDDHAVLIVKHEGRSLLLDNATDELVDGDAANDYRPILSFSADRRYLHGY